MWNYVPRKLNKYKTFVLFSFLMITSVYKVQISKLLGKQVVYVMISAL